MGLRRRTPRLSLLPVPFLRRTLASIRDNCASPQQSDCGHDADWGKSEEEEKEEKLAEKPSESREGNVAREDDLESEPVNDPIVPTDTVPSTTQDASPPGLPLKREKKKKTDSGEALALVGPSDRSAASGGEHREVKRARRIKTLPDLSTLIDKELDLPRNRLISMLDIMGLDGTSEANPQTKPPPSSVPEENVGHCGRDADWGKSEEEEEEEKLAEKPSESREGNIAREMILKANLSTILSFRLIRFLRLHRMPLCRDCL
ncbi:hypothetical protein F2Q69_00059756 [Brassica cretica]|uniref:Uncharacterized protein n=1 Tax=Brassica cretica TaxID=69181 RepID=A0A8S9RAD0_BRACR|nr:hypothetical protein F2Q69_00059756 [Brassica cretica]